jgi:hypothetical protein
VEKFRPEEGKDEAVAEARVAVWRCLLVADILS